MSRFVTARPPPAGRPQHLVQVGDGDTVPVHVQDGPVACVVELLDDVCRRVRRGGARLRRDRSGRPRGRLADYGARLDVSAHVEKDRRSQVSAFPPFGVPDLHHQLRRQPDRFAARQLGGVDERRPVGPEPFQHREHVVERAVVEPAADPARVSQPVVVVVSEHERSEGGRPGAGAGRVAPDHELLRLDRLDLQPRRASRPLLVTAVPPLADHPFDPHPDRGLEERLSVRLHVLHEPQRVAGEHRARQERLALDQRQPGDVGPVDVQQVERVVGHGSRVRERVRGAGQPMEAHRPLQEREVRQAVLACRDELAVDHELLGLELRHLLDDGRQPVGHILAGPAEHPHVAATLQHQRTEAVQLRLEDPFCVRERPVR